MKKAIIAAILLLALFLGSLWNIRYLDELTSSLIEKAETAKTLSHTGDRIGAEKALRSSAEAWLDADGYTHIFIRHAEVDAATDAYFEALDALRNADDADAALDKVIAHLQSIDSMEHITWKSVF